jgi:hypothetical protein
MACVQLDNSFPRISARRGQTVDLNVDFLHNGILRDPFAIRYVEIYKTQVVPHNLVATIPIVDPCDPLYPSPLCQDDDSDNLTGQCGTGPSAGAVIAGKYHLPFSIPDDFEVPDVYHDLWYYFPENPCVDGTDPCDCDLDAFEPELLKCCHRFWIYPDEWFCDDKLQTIRFGFEPLDQKFHSPETRPLEVGLMPLPLYDYNFNLVNPIIPFLRPTITIETQQRELLAESAPCEIGVRHGSYRSNPWVVKYLLDTSTFLKGTYQYQITLHLPDGSTRVSRKFNFTIA